MPTRHRRSGEHWSSRLSASECVRHRDRPEPGPDHRRGRGGVAGIALAVVDDDGALPAFLLVVVELAEIGDDVLTRPGIGADALDEGVVGVGLAIFGAGVAAQEHGGLRATQDGEGRHEIKILRFN